MKFRNKHAEHDDDIPVGRVLSRREMLGLLAGASTVFLVGCDSVQSTATQTSATTAATTSTTKAATTAASSTAATSASSASQLCVVMPALTEGPYFVDEQLNRSDIRSDPTDGTVKEGTPFKLTFNVSQVGSGSCTPYSGVFVDIWHCDAAGTYSDVVDNAIGFNTKGKKYLRGYQVTDANGKVEFTTIYPGWYQGRTVHIHFKIRNALNATQSHTFTSQLFFDDTITDQVYTQAPYASKGTRTMRNSADGIYQQGGSQLLLTPTKIGDLYTATFNIGLQQL